MNLSLCILLLHLFTLTSSSASAAGESPMMISSAAFTDELVGFFSRLTFIGASPNNRTDFPPPECCDDVSATVESPMMLSSAAFTEEPPECCDDISASITNGSAICVCYLILQPDKLGFPLNSTKLLSLTSFCPRNDQNSTTNSLKALCSDSAHLPPLHSITGGSDQSGLSMYVDNQSGSESSVNFPGNQQGDDEDDEDEGDEEDGDNDEGDEEDGDDDEGDDENGDDDSTSSDDDAPTIQALATINNRQIYFTSEQLYWKLTTNTIYNT